MMKAENALLIHPFYRIFVYFEGNSLSFYFFLMKSVSFINFVFIYSSESYTSLTFFLFIYYHLL